MLSCVGKVFTSLTSKRLYSFVENFELLGEEQAGFRKEHSTIDHLFVLFGLIDIYTKKEKRKLFCTFIDYSKAFDTVPHIHLLTKLLSTGINGRIFNIVKSIYREAKSHVKYGKYKGTPFNCEIGVRQGENLSPLLFALYLNDLEDFLARAYNGLNLAQSLIRDYTGDDVIVVYLKLFTLLYADDTIILAESSHELQAALNGMHHYCQIWKLKINTSKTRVVIFGNRKTKTDVQFKIGEIQLDIVDEYVYLGISVKYNGNLTPGMVKMRDQASRAMYSLINKSQKLGLSIDIQLHLFDTLVAPIALYGCEIWGCKNVEVIEQLHLKFMRILLKVNKATPKCMLYGELGRLPMNYNVELRVVNFWFRLVNGNKRKISYHIYKLLYRLDKEGIFHSDWIVKVKQTLVKCTLYDKYWVNQDSEIFSDLSCNLFKRSMKTALKEYYERIWLENTQNSSKCSLYKEFKPELKLEKYLLTLDTNLRINLTKYRLSNHKLPIEVGRHNNIIREERLCEYCKDDVGDEYHYMFVCPKFEQERLKLIPKNCIKRKSVRVFCDLMSTQSINTIKKLATLSKIIMNAFK